MQIEKERDTDSLKNASTETGFKGERKTWTFYLSALQHLYSC